MTVSVALCLLAVPAAWAGWPKMKPGEWEFAPPTTRYCFTKDTRLAPVPQSLQGCAPLQIDQTSWSFNYATTCSLLGVQVGVKGTVTLAGPDFYVNTTHVSINDGSGGANDTTVTTTVHRIGNCQADDSPPPD